MRSFFYIDLFLNARHDQAAVDKMSKAGWIEGLWLAQEVSVVREDSVHQMYEVRPFGKIETFWVEADVIGSERPQGRAADISRAALLIKNSSARIQEFIEELQNTAGLATLEGAITRNAPEVTVALANLKSQGIDFSGELKKIKAAYKIIKNAPYHREIEVIDAQGRVDEGKVRLFKAMDKAYRDLQKAGKEIKPAPVLDAE